MSVLKAVLGTFGDKALEVVDELVRDKDLADKLKHELKAKVIDSETQLAMARIELDKEVQRTHQAEAQQNDTYTKRTRPKVARQSWALAVVYVVYILVAPLLPTQAQLPVFDVTVFAALAGPALFYMGMRGVEKTAANIKGHMPLS